MNQINGMDWIEETDSMDRMDQTDQVYQMDPVDGMFEEYWTETIRWTILVMMRATF